MDTSKTYIKMCDCPEIQGQWKLTSIDFHGIPCADTHDVTGITFKPYKDSKKVKNVVTIWLPRQDQIQEMLEKHENTLDLLVHFYGFATLNESLSFDDRFDMTMEQLWLAFYIHEKHNKVWDGEKWTKK